MWTPRRIATLLIVVAGVSLAGGTLYFKWRDQRAFTDLHSLLGRFPVEDSTVVSVDLSRVRKAGLLSKSSTAPEAEYKQFMDGTGFNYRRDLDSVVASFSPSGTYFIARGRFDWTRLRAYATGQGGSCYEDLCRLQGSTPERHISFLPLRDDVLALAVSTDDLAATHLANPGKPVTAKLPTEAAWISVPGGALRAPGALPAGLRVYLSGLTNSDRVMVTFGPAGNSIEAHMEAICRTQDDARILESQLKSATILLKKSAGTDELASALMSGTFNQSGRTVNGVWPMKKDVFDSLTNGL